MLTPIDQSLDKLEDLKPDEMYVLSRLLYHPLNSFMLGRLVTICMVRCAHYLTVSAELIVLARLDGSLL